MNKLFVALFIVIQHQFAFSAIVDGRWYFYISDPTLFGWFTEIMRDRAQTYGWYDYRQSVLIGCISLLGLGILLAMIRFRLYLANSWRNYKITWVGIIVLLIIFLTQTSSTVYADMLIKQHEFGFNVSAILEISALLLIIIGTYYNKNKINPLNEAITLTINNYVETSAEGRPVQCHIMWYAAFI